jgi:hypothetical protein
MESLYCPLCRAFLEPTKRPHGLVWICRTCRAGAVTLPILRQVALRLFVNELWQAARDNGHPSLVRCPAGFVAKLLFLVCFRYSLLRS